MLLLDQQYPISEYTSEGFFGIYITTLKRSYIDFVNTKYIFTFFKVKKVRFRNLH